METISNGTAEIVFIASHLHDSRQDLIRSVATFKNLLLSSKDIITLVTNFLSLYFTTLVVELLCANVVTGASFLAVKQLLVFRLCDGVHN